jgi:hypothetical protein
MENKKVAIIFFGLTKNLGNTINSIKKNLFTPLSNNSIDYDIFIHTYKINGAYHNNWASEYTENYINEDVEAILNPKYFIWDNQETIIDSINFEEYYTKLGNWTGMTEEMTRHLIKNMCLALYSKKEITSFYENYKDDYDYAIIIRPDLFIESPIDINYFNELTDNNIILPEKDWWHGCNDRICIGKPNTILYCGKLFDDLKSYSEQKSIISEVYFLDKLKEQNISILKKDLKYHVVRIWGHDI